MVFKAKYKYKARLVVRGFLQGILEDTYAPVIDFTTVRVALASGVQKGYMIRHFDVRIVFLHGELED